MNWLCLSILIIFFSMTSKGENPSCDGGSDHSCHRDTNRHYRDYFDYISKEVDATQGEFGKCTLVPGSYVLDSSIPVQLSYLPASILPLFANHKSYRTILRMGSIDKQGHEIFRGLLIETETGWYLTTLKEEVDYPYPSTTQESSIMQAFEDFYKRHRNNSQVLINKIVFNNDMTVGDLEDGRKLTFDSRENIESFIAQNPMRITNSNAYLNNHTLRIPPEMYQIMHDQEFIQARQKRQYSKMMDLIYQSSLAVMGGNIRNALFVSLLMTDLRARGPCGSLYGRRGLEIVPPSLFDGEMPTLVFKNRLDAPQHFFAYALLRSFSGGSASQIISVLSKERQRLFPKFTQFFDRFHRINEPTGVDYDIGNPIRWMIRGEYATAERTRIETDVDKFYNELGIEFWNQLSRSQTTIPSSILNSSWAEQKKVTLGLKPSNVPSWKAYDPNLEVPRVVLLPPEQRNSNPISWDETPLTQEESIQKFKYICQNGVNDNSGETDLKLTGKYCDDYQREMQKYINKLYEENKSPSR